MLSAEKPVVARLDLLLLQVKSMYLLLHLLMFVHPRFLVYALDLSWVAVLHILIHSWEPDLFPPNGSDLASKNEEVGNYKQNRHRGTTHRTP